ncbi:MAG: hypothetical protein AAB554_03865 [Patescibacteria group bacterium]
MTHGGEKAGPPKSLQEALDETERVVKVLKLLRVSDLADMPLTDFDAALRMARGDVPTPQQLERIAAYLTKKGFFGLIDLTVNQDGFDTLLRALKAAKAGRRT